MMETFYWSILIAGFGGGVVRGLVGFTKQSTIFKSTDFKLPYFLFVIFLSGIIGLLTAGVSRELGLLYSGNFTPAIAFIAGYAGGDFLENVYKIITKKATIY
jgi:hypothetical protein